MVRLMEDDEEEQLRESPLRNQSTENRVASRGPIRSRHGRFENRSTQTLNSARAGDMAPFQGWDRDALSHCGDMEVRTALRAHCEIASVMAAPGEPRALFHGNAGFRVHFPALFEPVPDGAPRLEEGRVEERRPDDKDEENSVEIQIGRKLREMGDGFQHEHLQLFTRHQRGQLGLIQLVTTLYNFLFPRGDQQR
ncbi:BCL2 modifying factor 2 [Paramisgurnus dabryanus]|uniref:BCL2 modifying factor 2 n=1 Tax=Paramisgurnus dabryanus TaxID=90735 RepID=UPI0031F41097